MKKRYLGDAVYVQHDGYHVILSTEDGIRTTNEVFLEPHVLNEFERWLTEVRKAKGGKS